MEYKEIINFINWVADDATTLEEVRERALAIRSEMDCGPNNIDGISVSVEVYEKIRSYLRQRQNIQAIRTLRESPNGKAFSLRQLKTAVDNFASTM